MNVTNCSKSAEKAGLKESELTELVTIAKEAAHKGGRKLMDNYGDIQAISSKGRIGDLVTNADIESEKLVISHLNKETPGISILAEESGTSGPDNSLCWCVDPLDGTTNFANGYPFFATSIGLMWNDISILGAIYIPYLNEMYWCSPNLGSYCNEKRIHVSDKETLIDSLLVTGFAYDRQTRLDNNYAEFCWLTHRTRGVRRGGAAAVDLAFVAAGKLDGYWERGLSKWDLAAGVALVELAGGVISDYKDVRFDMNKGRILACTPGIREELKQELNKVVPLAGEMFGAPDLRAVGS